MSEVAGRVLCDAREARCRCREDAGHYPATPHRCDPRCGGAWRGSERDGTFEPVSLPHGAGTGLMPLPVPGLRFDEEW